MEVKVLVGPSECMVAFRDVVAWAGELHAAYAWASSSGGKADHWKALPLKKVKRVVLGIHFAQTEPYVLRRLRAQGVLRVVPDTGDVFHPKVLVALKGGAARVLVGSSNFTTGGFSGNTEVNIVLAGQVSDEIISKLFAFVDEQWKHPRAFEPNDIWLKQYEQLYARRPKAPTMPIEKKRPPKKIKSTSDLRIGWPQYAVLLRQQEWRSFSSGWVVHIFDHPEGSYLQELDACRAAFASKPTFNDLPLESRQLIAGWGGGSRGHLGWMGGAGYFKKLTRERPDNIGKYLDAVPLAGGVSMQQARQYLEGVMSGRGVAIGSASRLLSVKRPDLFLPANNASQGKILEVFGTRPDTIDRYLEVIEQIWSYDWFKAPIPSDTSERRLWGARVALLDALFYEPA